MKLQKQLSKKTEKKRYYRYTINIPEEIVKESDFKEGEELTFEAKKGEIRLKKD